MSMRFAAGLTSGAWAKARRAGNAVAAANPPARNWRRPMQQPQENKAMVGPPFLSLPLVGEGRVGGREVVRNCRRLRLNLPTPTPNPSPQGGGEHASADLSRFALPAVQRTRLVVVEPAACLLAQIGPDLRDVAAERLA